MGGSQIIAPFVGLALAWPAEASAYGRSEEIIDFGAELVAGKPVDASCAASDAEWITEVKQLFGPPWRYIHGYAVVGSSHVYLAPWICRVLDGELPTPQHTVGAALNVLAHEASHARGVADEAVAQCHAVAFGEGWERLTSHAPRGVVA